MLDRQIFVFVVLLSSLVITVLAPSESLAETLPDIVRLDDGGVVQGTIEVRRPGELVRIRLPNGEIRQYPMSRVRYAGPWTEEPPGAARAATTTSEPPGAAGHADTRLDDTHLNGTRLREARLADARFTAEGNRSLTLYRVRPALGYVPISARFERLCTAPCDVALEAGLQPLALAADTGPPVPLAQLTHVPNEGTLRGSYHSNHGWRTAGWLLVAASSLAGAGLLVGGFLSEGSNEPDSTTLYIAAGATLAVGFGVGFVMTGTGDEVSIRVEAP